jgi:hypothetical protein
MFDFSYKKLCFLFNCFDIGSPGIALYRLPWNDAIYFPMIGADFYLKALILAAFLHGSFIPLTLFVDLFNI